MQANLTEARAMRTTPVPDCDLCGAKGCELHANTSDAWGTVPGKFTIRQCTNPACGILWLDPLPIPEDIHLAYQTYYTHTTTQSAVRRTWKTPLLNLWRRALGVGAEHDALEIMFLGGEKPGRVLDVGCGNGKRLRRLQDIGWQPQGQEVDPESAAVAERDLGIPVYVGPLSEAPFPDEEFDAVISNHVFEHVHEPLELLENAWRLVKPGGILVFTMPNAKAYLHDVYGENWMGLDPPRHLRIYSPLAMVTLAHKAGIESPVVATTSARGETFVRGSIRVASARGMADKSLRDFWMLHSTLYYSTLALLRMRVMPLDGEELILRARKPLA